MIGMAQCQKLTVMKKMKKGITQFMNVLDWHL